MSKIMNHEKKRVDIKEKIRHKTDSAHPTVSNGVYTITYKNMECDKSFDNVTILQESICT